MSQAGCNAVDIQQCKAHWSEVYQADDSSLVVSDILMWAQVGLVTTLGSFLLFAIIHFERFGGDVQKRSLGNRLASNGAANAWLQTITRSLLIITVRYDLGNTTAYRYLSNCTNSLALVNIFLLDLIILLRYVQVVVWQRVMEIDEKLVQVGLTATLYLACSVFTFIFSVPGKIHYDLERAWSTEKNSTELPLEICMKRMLNSSSLAMDALSVQQALMCLSIAWNTYALLHIYFKMSQIPQAPEVVNDFNYEAQYAQMNRYNHLLPRTVINGCQVLTMGLMVTAITTWGDTMEKVLGGKRGYTINLFGLESFISSVILPMTLFACHKEARKHMLSFLGC